MECSICSEMDLELLSYTETETGIFDVDLKCRQCGFTFFETMTKEQLDYWR